MNYFKNNIIKMVFSIFIFINSIIFSFSKRFIADLTYNNKYVEQDSNALIKGTDYYIRFPANSNTNMTLNITIPKNNNNNLTYYWTEFKNKPEDLDIINTNFTNNKQLTPINSDNNNKIYSIEIEPSELYLVLYINIEETLDYLELYAKIDFIITEAECNKHYKFENIFEGNRLYFRINYNKYSGRDFDIELNYQAEDGDSPFQVDLCGFTRYPNDSEVFEIKKGWEKNLYGKPKFLKNNNYVWKYSSRTYENVKYLSIQIEPKLNIENLDFYISSSKGFPEWAIIIISIAIVIIIAAICILILISEKGREFCGIFLCCCYLCGCLTRIIKKR